MFPRRQHKVDSCLNAHRRLAAKGTRRHDYGNMAHACIYSCACAESSISQNSSNYTNSAILLNFIAKDARKFKPDLTESPSNKHVRIKIYT